MKRGRKPGSLYRYTCIKCGSVSLATGGTKNFKCSSCRELDRCGKNYACKQVALAIREGRLKPPANFSCVDCGLPASQYDHRDYNAALDVAPVCRSCNAKRGPAIPRKGYIEEALSQGIVPYSQRLRTRMLLIMIGIDVSCLDGMPTTLSIENWRDLWPRLAKSKVV